MGDIYKSMRQFSRADWIRLAVVVISLDAFFVWLHLMSLGGDSVLPLIDFQFFAGLQLTIFGISVLANFLTYLIMLIADMIVEAVPTALKRKLNVRRGLRRYRRDRIVIQLTLLFLLSSTEFIEDWWVYGIFLSIPVGYFLGFAKGKISGVSSAEKRARRAFDDRYDQLGKMIAILDWEINKAERVIKLSYSVGVLALLATFAIQYAERKKSADPFDITLLDANVVSFPLVGQTRYGLLAFDDSCECVRSFPFNAIMEITKTDISLGDSL